MGLAARGLTCTASCYKIHSNESISGFGRVGLAGRGTSFIGIPVVTRSPIDVRYGMERILRLNSRRVFLTSILTIRTSPRCVSRGGGFRLGSTGPLICSRNRCLKVNGGLKAFKCDIGGGGGGSKGGGRWPTVYEHERYVVG